MVEYSGCSASGSPERPVCELAPGAQLKLWARASVGAHLRFRLDGDEPPEDILKAEPTAGGTLLRLAGGAFEEVEILASKGAATARFRLTLRRLARPELLQEALSLGRSGELEQARKLLEERLSATSPDRWRGPALSLLGRIEERAGHPERAREILRQAVLLHQEQGELGREISDRCLLVRIAYYHLGDFSGALEELDHLPPATPGDADSLYLVALYRGTLALYTGDSRGAFANLAAAREQRSRLGDARGQWISSQMMARLLRRLGRESAAQEMLEGLTCDQGLLERLGPCDRAELFNNVGWDRLLALEAGRPAGDPLEPLVQALEALEAGSGCSPTERPSVELNLALAHLHGGRPEEAALHLGEARRRAGTASPRLLLWQLDLEARLDLQRGRFEAARSGFQRLAERAAAVPSLDAQWRAHYGLAQVAEAAARPREALGSYARAEDLLDEISLRAPLGLGRGTSVQAGEGSTRRYLELLLAMDLKDEALQAARRSRSRILRGLMLEERIARLDSGQLTRWSELLGRYERLSEELDSSIAEAWKAPRSERSRAELARQRQRRELTELLDQALALLDSRGLATQSSPLVRAPGEVALVYHPARNGWIGFAVDGGGVRTARLGDLSRTLPAEELGRRLLGPFLPRLLEAPRVRILAYGWLEEIDFHALPAGGGSLEDHLSVAYSLDLPPRPGAAPTRALRRALVIADPTESLSAVRREVLGVATRLRALGIAVSPLAGAEANRRAVLEGLRTADLLHFAGHAELAGGLDGALLLSGGGQLSAGDVLSAPSVPAAVVLAACDSGLASSGRQDPLLGLAQAFLVAGSREVLATSRPVDDRVAAEVVAAVYRTWDGVGPLADALHQAWADLEEPLCADRAAFRVLER